MDNNEPHYESLQDQLNSQQEALVQIYKSVEKTRKMIFWSGVINMAIFIVPMIAVAILLPKIMGTFMSSMDGLAGISANIPADVLNQPGLRESLENLKNLGL